MMKAYKTVIGAIAGMFLFAGCYSNNCPLENTVLCNYGFYDMEGNAITIGDALTVTTLLPGWHDVYTYRKLGSQTVEKTYIDSTLIKNGYTMTQSVERKDTVLLNKKTNAATISLPMSFFNKVDTLIFSYSNIPLKDTVKVSHDSYPHVELPECGTYRFHTLKNVEATDFNIDHIEVKEKKVNYEGKQNIKIYFNGVVE